MSLIDSIEVGASDALDTAVSVAGRQTPIGEYLGAQLTDGWLNSSFGLAGRFAAGATILPDDRVVKQMADLSGRSEAEVRADLAGQGLTPLSEDEWKASPYFRDGLEFEAGTTTPSAAQRAAVYDRNAYRDWLIQNRRAGLLDTAAGFAAGVVGTAPDPINYIPLGGVAFRARAAAKLGNIGGRAAVGAAEASIGAAILEPLIVSQRSREGDDMTFADILVDIGMSAVVGSAFGGGSAAFKRFRENRQLANLRTSVATETAALHRLDQAAQDIALGRAIDVDPITPKERAAIERVHGIDDVPVARALDHTVAGGEAVSAPEIRQAEQTLTTPYTLEQRAQELGVDPKSGAFDELGQFEQLRQANVLTPEEAQAFQAADTTFAKTEQYARAYEAAAVCLTRN